MSHFMMTNPQNIKWWEVNHFDYFHLKCTSIVDDQIENLFYWKKLFLVIRAGIALIILPSCSLFRIFLPVSLIYLSGLTYLFHEIVDFSYWNSYEGNIHKIIFA